jgi:hypothetical protein
VRSRVAVVLATALLAGCTTSEAGVPHAADQDAPAASPSLADLKPCELLSADDLRDVGLEKGLELSALACDWKRTTDSSGVGLNLFPEAGIDTATDQGTRVDIGTRLDAYEVEAPGGDQGACAVLLDVSESSYVMLTATNGTDTAAACDLASKVAERADSRLS